VAATGTDAVAVGMAGADREPVVVDAEAPVARGTIAVGLVARSSRTRKKYSPLGTERWSRLPFQLTPWRSCGATSDRLQRRYTPPPARTASTVRSRARWPSFSKSKPIRPPLAPNSFEGLASSTRSRSESAALELDAMMPSAAIEIAPVTAAAIRAPKPGRPPRCRRAGGMRTWSGSECPATCPPYQGLLKIP
jgi:hypothetical protein